MSKDITSKYCSKCKKETNHLKCGFGNVGGFLGNARWRCTVCNEEKVK